MLYSYILWTDNLALLSKELALAHTDGCTYASYIIAGWLAGSCLDDYALMLLGTVAIIGSLSLLLDLPYSS